MILLHLAKKALLRIRSEGIKDTLKELVYFRRVMVAIEKDIQAVPSLMTGTMRKIVVDRDNYRGHQNTPGISNVVHFCKRGALSLLVFDGDDLLGYQIWTLDNAFPDLRKLDIRMKADEAYLFDLFVFPRFRGTQATKTIVNEVHNELVSRGIKKFYGFYFEDNVKALWWHRAYLHCREIKRISTTRILFVEMTGRRLTFKA